VTRTCDIKEVKCVIYFEYRTEDISKNRCHSFSEIISQIKEIGIEKKKILNHLSNHICLLEIIFWERILNVITRYDSVLQIFF